MAYVTITEHNEAMRLCGLADQKLITLSDNERTALNVVASAYASNSSCNDKFLDTALRLIEEHKDVYPRFGIGALSDPNKEWITPSDAVGIYTNGSKQLVARMSSHDDGNVFEAIDATFAPLNGQSFLTRSDALQAVAVEHGKAVANSRAEVDTFFSQRGDLQEQTIDSSKGRYSGLVLASTTHHVVQEIGRGKAVVHDAGQLLYGGAELSQGKLLNVQYKAGWGKVEDVQQKAKEMAMAR